MSKRALVLSSGGSKGAYQVGVLKRWMGEDNKDYDIICGVSVGALNAAGLATTKLGSPRQAIESLERFWLHEIHSTSSVYTRWKPFGRLHSLWRRSVYDSTPFRDMIRRAVSHDLIKKSERIISISSVCLDTGEQVFIDQTNDMFIEWLLASASVPILFEPIEIDGKLWSDGAILNVTPLEHAISLGATDIDVIMCYDPWKKIAPEPLRSRNAIPGQLTRTFNLIFDKMMQNDIELSIMKNHRYGNDDIRIRVAVPTHRLVDDSMQFKSDEIVRMIQQGYDDSRNVILYT